MNDLLIPRRFAPPVDAAEVAADWAARGYSCEPLTDPPGQVWRDFVHAADELVTVVDGRLELEVAGIAVMAGPGDEVFIPKGARHTVRNLHRGATRWLFGYCD